MQGPFGPDAGVVDHQLQHPGRRQQNASAPQFLDQQDGKLARLSVGLGYGREPGHEVAGLCPTEALEAAAAHQLGQLLTPRLGTIGAGAEDGGVDTKLARDEGGHGGGWLLPALQCSAGVA